MTAMRIILTEIGQHGKQVYKQTEVATADLLKIHLLNVPVMFYNTC
jgi:hypothetical protein